MTPNCISRFHIWNVGWKIYMINGVWDVLEMLFVIFFWVETKGKTLEEIDSLFDTINHNDLATLEKNAGETIIGQELVEAQTELPKKERY
ncbi:MFS sugar transporter-like protein [Penicillium lividum]|nr:MFS sugar transporter-like protein [Penicillium lividum]